MRALGPVVLAVAAGTALTAPQASAAVVRSVTVSQGLANGYGTTCSYEIKAIVDASIAHRTMFRDNGWEIRGNGGPKKVAGDTVTQMWTPSTPGEHVITAEIHVGTDEVVSTTVQVGNGINLGSACVVN
ncbi:hypothetical protein GV794_26825 [Nocardia cyriacigeorgica]|uniref:Secreted protein n=1 Tax=Nocardia cyriacigeorgica TaxID=135487 RepID=A0ABX0CZQ2_9NOCA|nr:hypothetical protein [Nocardia cyriacigeorgica]NEW59222.1 hypothetical protein [Nocardia cyriacigeorgica]